MNHSRWNIIPPAPAQYFAQNSGFPPLIAQLLYNRGLTEPSQLELFVSGDERLAGDPFLLPDMHQAVTRIYRALLSGETIAIYGDFDVDGITATVLLVHGLSVLGGKTLPYIPHRKIEGHGLRTEALEELRQQGASLVITVDCGTTDLAEIEQAKRMGLDIVVTDHHTPLDVIPPNIAVVNPKMPESKYPLSELAGVGVAYKLIQALFQSVSRDNCSDELIDLVALGTVADMAPLLGENRYLVKRGLEMINKAPRLGLNVMITQAGLSIGSISTESISWTIAPRLNAAGRLEHAIESYKLLITGSREEAEELSMWLDRKNTERQQLTASVLEKAKEQILAQGIPHLLFASAKGYPIGIAGLVANRLLEEFYHPAIVVEEGEDISHGSCRSIPEFNIILALNRCSKLLSRYGGHSRAAGFTLPTKHLPLLKERLTELAATRLEGLDLRPYLNIDAEVLLPELGGATFQSIHQLAPFGQGNPIPTFLSRAVELVDCRTMGSGSDHLRLKLKQSGSVWDGVGFRLGNCLPEISSPLDIVYNLEIDRWCGRENLRLNLLDLASTLK
ncbi:single-stranded-DNA-specific exonuclease RecJ [Chloroflexota bacterium]